MMKTAEPATRDDCRRRRRPILGGALVRCVFAQCIMSPVLVVIRDVFSQEPAKMVFIQRNDMIEDFPASTSDPAFRDSILPGRLHARSFRLQSRRLQKLDHFCIELRVVIQNEVTIWLLSGKCLPKLLDHPICRWVSSDVAV